jgi:cytoskeletal protein RodZ
MNGENSLRTPGELLRGGREARGLSLADVSECTKIPPRLVEALESDEYHKLSGGLYVKSFLRAYASCVGLNADELQTLYEQAAGAGAAATAPGDGVWVEEETTVRRVGVSLGAVIGWVAVVVGVLATVGVLVWRLVFAGRGG